jgi:hypothetical protein
MKPAFRQNFFADLALPFAIFRKGVVTCLQTSRWDSATRASRTCVAATVLGEHGQGMLMQADEAGQRGEVYPVLMPFTNHRYILAREARCLLGSGFVVPEQEMDGVRTGQSLSTVWPRLP